MNTEEEIRTYENELAYYYKRRQLFLWIGLGLLVLSLILFIVAIALGVNATNDSLLGLVSALGTFSGLAFSASILLFILRAALYNARIRSRKEKIAAYKASAHRPEENKVE